MTTDEQTAFLSSCLARAGADVMITPREIIRDYMSVLNILYQNPDVTFAEVAGSGVVTLKTAYNGENSPGESIPGENPSGEADSDGDGSAPPRDDGSAYSLEDIEL